MSPPARQQMGMAIMGRADRVEQLAIAYMIHEAKSIAFAPRGTS